MIDGTSLNASELKAYNLVQKATNGDNGAIDELCTGLFDATAGKWGTDEGYVNQIINGADSKTIAQIMDRYSEVTGSEIYKDIQNDYSGKEEKRIIEMLNTAYLDAKGTEYTGDNDGKLSNQQIGTSVINGIKSKALSIGLMVGGTIAAPAIASAAGAALTGIFGAATAAAITTVAAPVLAVAGIATAGYMVYKGVTQTANAIKEGQNATADDEAMNAVQSGTQGVIDATEGAYIGYQSVKGLVSSVKNIKAQIEYNNKIQAEAQARTAQEQRILEAQQYQDELIEQMQHPSGKSAEESAKVFEEAGLSDTEIDIIRKELANEPLPPEDDRIFGYDGHEEGAIAREDIRTRILTRATLNDSALEVTSLDTPKGQTAQLPQDSKYYSLGEPKFNAKKGEYVYICENLKDMPDVNGLRGKTPLFGAKNVKGIKFRLGKVQDAGINTVIDLRAEGECSAKILKVLDELGMNYVNFPVEDGAWTTESLDGIANYIKAVNSGDFYVGCANGQARTDLAVAINYAFNPQAQNLPQLYYGTTSSSRVSVAENLNRILEIFSENQSAVQSLGWESYDDFLASASSRIQKLIASLSVK